VATSEGSPARGSRLSFAKMGSKVMPRPVSDSRHTPKWRVRQSDSS
jgi:hypothetical protein